jgi:periplasmic divalent cation tolerance protein
MYAEIHTTCASRDEAERIAERLIADRLAACVHLRAVESVFRWQGQVTHDGEVQVSATTLAERFAAVAAAVAELHSYDLPALTMTPITGGSEAYLDWVTESVAR